MNYDELVEIRRLFPDPRNRRGFDGGSAYIPRFGTHIAVWDDGRPVCRVYGTAVAGRYGFVKDDIADDGLAVAAADRLESRALADAQAAGEPLALDYTEDRRRPRLIIGTDSARMTRDRHALFNRAADIRPWPFATTPTQIATTLDTPQEPAMTTITNAAGRQVDFDAAAALMDNDISLDLNHGDGLSAQEFFDAYCRRHRAKFRAEFEPNKPNPVW